MTSTRSTPIMIGCSGVFREWRSFFLYTLTTIRLHVADLTLTSEARYPMLYMYCALGVGEKSLGWCSVCIVVFFQNFPNLPLLTRKHPAFCVGRVDKLD